MLRDVGDVRITTPELMDALVGMAHIDLLDKTQFKALLKGALIKNEKDLKTFERFFQMVFKAFDTPAEALSPPLEKTEISEKVKDVLTRGNGLFSPEFRALILEGLPGLAPAISETGRLIKPDGMHHPQLEKGPFAGKIRKAFQANTWPEQTRQLIALLRNEGVSTHHIEKLEKEIGKKSRLFDEMTREYAERYAQIKPKNKKDQTGYPRLEEKEFSRLEEWEIQALLQTVRELVKKIRDALSLRQRRMRRGRLDLKHTLRRNMRFGGIPMEISYRDRKRSKGRIITLCDVSRSVWNASRFTLHLIYALQDQFDDVRSFVFVDRLGEITRYFEKKDPNAAIETALDSIDIPFNRDTNYGRVLRQFCMDHLDAVNRKTNVIIIGDGRNNEFDSGETFLTRIQSRARRVIWLNPEDEMTWHFGDSLMHVYGPCCDEVRECRNLKQLIELVESITC